MTLCDIEYREIIREIVHRGDFVESRNSPVKSLIDCRHIVFRETPLVTWRKTAWKKAIREMEWFMSGDSLCPDELRDWWDGQLNRDGSYIGGYGDQLRSLSEDHMVDSGFDQVRYLLEGLRDHKNSRRLVISTWNTKDMSEITSYNDNQKTPTNCHGSIIQCHVRDSKLHMTQYQRSADILLGVPHNWLQYFSLLLYLSHWSELEAGSLRWIFGDVHLYQEESHIECAKQIMQYPVRFIDKPPKLVYNPTVSWTGAIPEFKASDFAMVGTVTDPIVTIRPKLL
jgi:thymidylate synthase